MQNTPKALRLHIAILGEVNVGKSTFLNLMTGQNVSIVDKFAGTTTDVVEKAQELHPLGPVLWMDTAGFGDQTPLSEKRLQKTCDVLEKTDVVILLKDETSSDAINTEILNKVLQKNIPLIKVVNKRGDFMPYVAGDEIILNAADISKRTQAVLLVENALLSACGDEILSTPVILGDLIPPRGVVVMIVPIDYEAPKGRLILPQVQAIRDCLDFNQTVIITNENGYLQTLQNLKKKPDLVVCDSQVVKFMVQNTPQDVKCTTFSILMARLKGDIRTFANGAEAIWQLKDDDKVLIAESCTHHAVDDDIGRVKIPRLLTEKTGKKLIFEFASGCDFKQNLKDYALIVQCGGCTQNRKAILSRITAAQKAGVCITNYGMCLSALNGILERVLEPFAQSFCDF